MPDLAPASADVEALARLYTDVDGITGVPEELASEILRGVAEAKRPVVYRNDDFCAWVDGSSIQIKSITAHGDPVDFGTSEVKDIIAALTRMVTEIDGDEE